MTGDVLRRAAVLMRGRAEKATPGPWESLDSGDRLVAWKVGPGGFDDSFDYVIDEPISNEHNATHIASWHPAVALAVADWLESAEGEMASPAYSHWTERDWQSHPALAVARAYLGETP